MYRTGIGQVSLHYKIGAAPLSGFVGVEAKQADGTVLPRQDYELREG